VRREGRYATEGAARCSERSEKKTHRDGQGVSRGLVEQVHDARVRSRRTHGNVLLHRPHDGLPADLDVLDGPLRLSHHIHRYVPRAHAPEFDRRLRRAREQLDLSVDFSQCHSLDWLLVGLNTSKSTHGMRKAAPIAVLAIP